MNEDRFGRDPQVRLMRELFARLEAWDRQKVAELPGLSIFDPRLRSLRSRTLAKQQQTLNQKGPHLSPDLFVQAYQDAYDEELSALDPTKADNGS